VVDRLAGNVTPIRAGGQIAYRLGGDAELENDQVAYRLGEQNDARQVFWIGDGPTAQTLGVTPGEAVTGADVERVYALMDGVNPETGEVLVAPKVAVAESAKLPAVPAYDAIVWAAAERGRSAEDLFAGRDRKDWEAFTRQVQAKGDTWRVPVERIEALGEAARVRVEAAYGRKQWADAVESKGQRVPVGIKGYDVGLTLSKGASLGLVMAEGDRRGQLATIARKAALETYRELGGRVVYGAKGHHGGGQVAEKIAGSGFAGTATMEVTSRADDPHVHFHAMIANLTICEDGKARTIGAGGRDVLAHGAWASERFRMKYREATTAAGLAEWGWNEATGEYDQLDISADARALASKRHKQITDEKDIFGADAGKRIDAMSERITREAKSETTETLAEVAARFAAELGEKNLELHGDSGLIADSVAEWYLDDWIVYLDSKLTEHNAVFTRVQVETQIQRRWPAHQLDHAERDVQAVTDAYLAHAQTLEVTQTGMSDRLTDGTRYTTKAMLDGEKTVYETTANGVGRGFHTLDPAAAEMALQTYEAAEGFTLNQGQRAMFMRWTLGGNQVDLTIGAAGTGKTAAAEAARYAYEAAGMSVMGISTSGLAAQNLGAAAGIEVTTAFALAKAIGEGRAPDVDVLMWDEMGMASTREQAVILAWAASNGVDVRGMGDPKQLDSVGAGSTYGRQCEQVGAVELSENMRQQHAHEREAVAQLRTGDVGLALGIYADAGQINVSRTLEDRITLMAANWAADAETVADCHERLTHAVMLSQTNACVEQLHDAARAEGRARGWITGPDVEYRGPNGLRSWAVGDAVLIRHTIHSTGRDRQTAIYNGQRAIVTGIDPATRVMGIEWKDAGGTVRTRTLPAEYVAAHVAPGFALTNHGAQGQSLRFVHADPGGADRSAAYVQTTRSIEALTLYTDLTTLGISGTQRIDVLRLDDQARAQWAARELAQRIQDRGWQQGETAHDATNTPIPMPEPPEQTTPEQHREPNPPDTRPEWLRQAFPDPAAKISREQVDTLLAQRVAERAAQRQAEKVHAEAERERQARMELAATPRKERPYWKWTSKELDTETEKLRATITQGEKLPGQQTALDTRVEQLEAFRAERERAQVEIVDRANTNIDGFAHTVREWKNEAKELVVQAEQPLKDAEARAREKSGKRFGQKTAANNVEAAKQQLRDTFPQAGDPGDSYNRAAWRERAIAETIAHLHGPDIQQWRETFGNQDQTIIASLAAERQRVNDDLLAKLPRADYEYGTNSGGWETQARRPSGYQQQGIEPAAQRWTSHNPSTLVRSAESFAIEAEARHKDITTALDLAARRIEDAQRKLNAIPGKSAEAAGKLDAITREQSIRQAQPPTAQTWENDRRQATRQRDADKQRQQQQERARQERQRHRYDPPHHGYDGPSQGHGRSM
jgi:conjugative relaxase-like TrwC/TraI family protein